MLEIGEEFEDFSQKGSLRSMQSNKEPDIILELAEDREGYLKDKNCVNCLRNFNLPGIAHSKKLFCLFCYRGYCINCLNFDYYHSETKNYEKMCSLCHHKLSIKSQNFNHELKLYRLERIGLIKEIKLASQQREAFVKERQIAAEELENVKMTMGKSENSIDQEINQLRSTNKEVTKKIERANKHFLKEQQRYDTLMEKYLRFKKELDKEKKGLEDVENFMKHFKGEINSINPRLSVMKSAKAQEIFKEEDIIEKIEELKNEIARLEEVLDDKLKMNSDVCEILQEIEEQIQENKKIIKDLTLRLSALKGSESEEFSDNEKMRLDQLREQIKQLDDLIRINQDLKTQTYTKMYTFGEPPIQKPDYSQSSELKSYPTGTAPVPQSESHKCCFSCHVI